MSRENGYLGEKMQISNSPVSIALKNKFDFFFNSSYEQINTAILSIANILGTKLGLDTKKISLLCKLNNLGKVDGGQVTLDRINSLVGKDERISEMDIAKYNLIQIFPDFESMFSKKDYDEIYSFVEKKYETPEAKTVDYASDLCLITEYMKRYHSWQGTTSIGFINAKADELASVYKGKQIFEKNKDIADLVGKINAIPYTYDFTELDKYLETEYLSGSDRSKNTLIEVANRYDSELEKKSSVRRM